jgi:hypothetical protein
MPVRSVPIAPVWTLQLDHAATRVAATIGATRVAIASEGPLVSVAANGVSSMQTICLSQPAREIAISPDAASLAVVSASGTLQILELESSAFGRLRARWDAPVHGACAFSRDGRFLWTVGNRPDETAEIHCYDARSGAPAGEHRFKPLIGGCGFVFTVHPQDDVLALWACGGPDELWNYWIRLTAGGVDLQHQPALDGWTPPCFNVRGDRFVARGGYDLAAFAFPDCEPVYSPETSEDDDEDGWRESLCYLDSVADDRVLTSTNEGRLFVVGLEAGERIAEVALQGHEPRPCHQVYTALSKSDDRLCTDLHTFYAAGPNLLLSVHTNGKTTNRKDTLLLWHAPS